MVDFPAPKAQTEVYGARKTHLDLIYFRQKWVCPEFLGCLPPPLHRGRQWLPAQYCHQSSVARTTSQWLRPYVMEGHKAQRRIPGAGRRRPSSQGKQGQPRSCRGASGTLRTQGCGQLFLSAGVKGSCQVTTTEQSPLQTREPCRGGELPSRTQRTNNVAKSTGTGQILVTAGTGPGTKRAEAIRAISLEKEQTNLYQSRQAQSCLKVVQHTAYGVRVPSALCRQPAN